MYRSSRTLYSIRAAFGILAVAGLAGLSATAQAQTYTLTDLGTLGGSQSFATDVNNSGQVVGNSLTSDGSTHGFFYNPGGSLKDLGTTVTGINPYTGESSTYTGTNSYANGINNKGQISGNIDGGGGFVSSPNGGTLNGSYFGYQYASYIVGINDKGQVVGGDGGGQVFLTDPSVPESTVQIPNSLSPVDFNNNGQVLCNVSESAAELYNTADGTFSNVDSLGENYYSFFQVNDKGQVVGGTTGGDDARNHDASHAYLTLANGTLNTIDLGTLDPNPDGFGPDSEAHGLNNNEQVVGTSGIASDHNIYHAFLWENGVMTDLNSLIAPGLGFTLTDATAISDTGYIVGNGTDAFGHDHAFLLSPAAVPEASTTVSFGLLLLLGAGAMAVKRRKVSA